MSNLNFKLTTVVPQDTNEYKAHLNPGIHEVKIVNVEEGTNKNGKDYIAITFENLNGTRTHTETMYCSTESGIEWTSRRIKEIFECLYPSTSIPENLIVAQLKKAFVGKSLRCMFLGEEYEKKDKSIGLSTKLRLSNFCESLSIPATESRFEFDPSKHIKRLEDLVKKSSSFIKPISNDLDLEDLDNSAMDEVRF